MENSSGEIVSHMRSALSQIIWTEAEQRLEQALGSLEKHYQEVIILRTLEE